MSELPGYALVRGNGGKLRVVMLCGRYLPDSVGGTEVFVDGLARELKSAGVDVHVVCHSRGEPVEYEFRGIPVHELPDVGPGDARQTYSLEAGDPQCLAEMLNRLKPDLVHVHNWTRTQFRVAKAAGIPVVATHHVPGVTCIQRSLMFRGREQCDGRIEVARCTQCRACAFGRVPPPLDWLVGHVPMGRLASFFPGRVNKLLLARSHTELFKQAVGECLADADAIHVLARWALDVLVRNGVSREKLNLVRTGLPVDAAAVQSSTDTLWPRAAGANSLRVVYWGRIDPVKGIDVLLNAVRLLPGLPLDVLILGGGGKAEYLRELQAMVSGDSRVRFHGEVPPEGIAQVLERADVGVVPSVWLETGPLTVLEAQAAGIPVVGSRLGGIAEICEEGRGSRLFPAGDSAALARILKELANSPATLSRLKDSVPPPRSMCAVATELIALYDRLLA